MNYKFVSISWEWCLQNVLRLLFRRQKMTYSGQNFLGALPPSPHATAPGALAETSAVVHSLRLDRGSLMQRCSLYLQLNPTKDLGLHVYKYKKPVVLHEYACRIFIYMMYNNLNTLVLVAKYRRKMLPTLGSKLPTLAKPRWVVCPRRSKKCVVAWSQVYIIILYMASQKIRILSGSKCYISQNMADFRFWNSFYLLPKRKHVHSTIVVL